MKRMNLGLLALTLALVACGDEDIKSDDTGDSDGGVGAGVGGGAGDDGADGGSGGGGSYFTPVAIGLELWSGYNGAAGDREIDSWTVETSDGDVEENPYVIVTLADLEYFSLGSEDRDGHYCEMYYQFVFDPNPDLRTYKSTITRNDNPTDGANPWGPDDITDGDTWDGTKWEGQLFLLGPTNDTVEVCESLNPTHWPGDGDQVPDGSPYMTLEGMYYGVAFGDHTGYLQSGWKDEEGNWVESYEDYRPFLFTSYTAINHVLGNGDIERVGYDWTESLMFQWEEPGGKAVLIDNPDDPSTKILVGVEGLEGGDQDGIVRSFAAWYEDFPLINPDDENDMSVLLVE